MRHSDPFVGHKFDRRRDIKETAKLVRKDIRDAIKKGELPEGLKASVRISRYSMGQSLDVTVKAAPKTVIINPARLKWDMDNPHAYPGDAPDCYTEDGRNILDTIEALVGSYNYDNSDSQTDYFDRHFYSNVSFDYELERFQKETFKGNAEFPDLSRDAFELARSANAEPEVEKTTLDVSKILGIPVFNLPETPTC